MAHHHAAYVLGVMKMMSQEAWNQYAFSKVAVKTTWVIVANILLILRMILIKVQMIYHNLAFLIYKVEPFLIRPVLYISSDFCWYGAWKW